MKKKLLMSALIALTAVACSVEDVDQNIQPDVQGLSVSASVEQPGDGSKTSLDGLNVNWSVGDRIYLTDGANYAIYEAESAASSTSFKYVSGAVDLTGVVYAYYPAENVTDFNDGTFTATIPSAQPYTAGGFADGINPMTAKTTVEDGVVSLSFKNVMSFVKLMIADVESGKTLVGLSLSSTAEPAAALCGTATVTVGENGIPSTSIVGSPTVDLSGVSASLSSIAFPIYIAVPAGNLGKLKITANTSETTGCYSQAKVASNALTAERSSINSYSPMQISSFSDKTREAELPANCYMVNATTTSIIIPLSQAIEGWNAIKALEPSNDFDMSKITSGERTIAVRWLDNASGSISLSSINSGSMTLALACTNGTNAVVDLKNGDEIVWSWHLWFTDYKPAEDQEHTLNGQVHTYSGKAFQAGGLYEGKVMMDRNLGATVTGVSGPISQPTTNAEAEKYFGLFYQFGRKDPFAATGTVTVYDASSVKKTYAQAAQEPATFYHIGSTQVAAAGAAWSSTDVNASPMTDPWNSNGPKSAFDPCPAGWRIPNNGTDNTKNVWNGMTASTWKGAVSGASNTSGQLWCGAWLPAAGCRRAPSGASFNRGASVFFWAASPRVVGAGYFGNFSSGGVGTAYSSNGSRAYGLSVRCIKE